MGIFRDDDHSFEVLGSLWQQFLDDPDHGKAFKEANITLKFNMKDPEGKVYVTPNGVMRGEQEIKSDVEMTLSCDTAHKFWLREISMPAAMARRLITSKGSMNNVMRLLPLMKPAYDMYPEICKKHGLLK
ncbi:MAG: hypothetical protein ACYC4H_04545 [Desulfocucumaceae bacterium]